MQTETLNNSVIVNPKVGNIVEMSFDDDIIHPSYYRMELNALDKVSEDDEVIIHVTSDGGRLDTGITVVNSLLKCKAPVTAVLSGNCHSCGSIIFLAAHQHEIGVASEMLLHAGAGGLGGTPSQQKNRVASYHRQLRELFQTVYSGFLSPQELDQMIEDDKEFIFGTEEIKERLHNMYQHRSGEVDKYHQEMEDMMWEENNAIIDATVEELDFTDEEKAIFNKVRKALDEELEKQECGVPEECLSDEPTSEDVEWSGVKIDIAVPLYDNEGDLVGEITAVFEDGVLFDKYVDYDNLTSISLEEGALLSCGKPQLNSLYELLCGDEATKGFKNKETLTQLILEQANTLITQYLTEYVSK